MYSRGVLLECSSNVPPRIGVILSQSPSVLVNRRIRLRKIGDRVQQNCVTSCTIFESTHGWNGFQLARILSTAKATRRPTRAKMPLQLMRHHYATHRSSRHKSSTISVIRQHLITSLAANNITLSRATCFNPFALPAAKCRS